MGARKYKLKLSNSIIEIIVSILMNYSNRPKIKALGNFAPIRLNFKAKMTPIILSQSKLELMFWY